MRGPFRIEGYAIVCSDGAIADATGFMPDSLKLEADQRFFAKALDGAAVVVHGRMSHEGQPNSPKRRRLILTRRVKALAPTRTTRTQGSGTLRALRSKGLARRSAVAPAGSRSSAARWSTAIFWQLATTASISVAPTECAYGAACRFSRRAGLAARRKKSSRPQVLRPVKFGVSAKTCRWSNGPRTVYPLSHRLRLTEPQRWRWRAMWH